MKIAVISDIHSNLEALSTALRAIITYDVSEIYCLGDIVGYGADPGPCVDLVRRVCTASVRGNHDDAVALEKGLANLPRNGRKAAIHNREHLTEDQLDYLAGLPYTFVAHNCTFVHASPLEPEAWVRLDTVRDSMMQFEHFDTDYCFVGHTHVPAILSNKLGAFRVRRGPRYVINVGSVGQPRDFNPRLSFGIFETEAVEYENIRLPYDVGTAAQKIKDAGLPKRLAERLLKGE